MESLRGRLIDALVRNRDDEADNLLAIEQADRALAVLGLDDLDAAVERSLAHAKAAEGRVVELEGGATGDRGDRGRRVPGARQGATRHDRRRPRSRCAHSEDALEGKWQTQ